MNYIAYLQKKPRGRPHSPLSVRAVADAMAISERLLSYAQELRRSGREDLVAAVERGEMTVAGAVMELHGIALPDRYDKLVQAWNHCDEDERTPVSHRTGRGRNGHARPVYAGVVVASC
jgi:hypothetical protein